MASPASPESPEPGRRAAPTTARSGGGLALMSLLLSLAPLVALGLIRLVAATASSLPGAAVTALSVVIYAGSFFGSLAAVITGWLSLRRTGQQPDRAATRALAVAGIMLGVIGLALLVIGGVVVGLLLQSCSANPSNCG